MKMDDQSDKLAEYRRGDSPLPADNRLWPLFGKGFDRLGQEGMPITRPFPEFGPDELLVRHDAVGLCFSDTKVIRAGQDHPRIYRDMHSQPVVLGHEVTLTIVGIGDNLANSYRIGERFIIQADIYVEGVNLAYGYEIQGGLSQYSVIDNRVLDADDGNHLIAVDPDTGYAESALTEPWTCVNTAYNLKYRTGIRTGGTLWIIGTEADDRRPYTIGSGFDAHSHPDRLLLTRVPSGFRAWLLTRAGAIGIEVRQVDDVSSVPAGEVDDIVVLGADADVVENASPALARFGTMVIMADCGFKRKVAVDVGRVHYNRWVFVGSRGEDVAAAYTNVPIRSTLKPGGRAWFVGAGGPMGQMHVQRALQSPAGPAEVFCTARSDTRLTTTAAIFGPEANEKDVKFVTVSREDEELYRETLQRVGAQGFDDIVVMAPSSDAISEAAEFLAPGGVMNIFAGVARGTLASIDLSDVNMRDVRYIGHSGLTTEDMRLTIRMVESGALSPNRLVSAVGSLAAARDGLRAVSDAVFPGKIVIFPQIRDLLLTPLPDLKHTLPSVFAKLKSGKEWTLEAEEELLSLMLP
jgi:threonine dehydrogenase-like Zn-dependent dehydrogenase